MELSAVLDPVRAGLGLFTNLNPEFSRYCRERAVLAGALTDYKTPANDHLRRGLRFAWMRAATTLFHHRLAWAKEYSTAPGAAGLIDFKQAIEQAFEEIRSAATQAEIGESPIDASLTALIEGLTDHYLGEKPEPAVEATFAPTLAALTARPVEDLPMRLVEAAANGITIGGKTRTFGQLLFDEFARLDQEPDFYPQAGKGVARALSDLNRKAHTQMYTALISRVDTLIMEFESQNAAAAEEARAQLDDTPLKAFRDELAAQGSEIFGILDKVGQDVIEIKDGVGRVEAGIATIIDVLDNGAGQSGPSLQPAAIEAHRPSHENTVMFAGHFASDAVVEPFERARDEISRRARARGSEDSIDPVAWDFSQSWGRETNPEGQYTKTDAWTTLNELVTGCVLVLGESEEEERAISGDLRLFGELKSRSWLENPIHDLHHVTPIELFNTVEAGAVPLTFTSRFAVECLLRGIQLLVVIPDAPEEVSTTCANLVRFLQDQGVTCITHSKAVQTTDWADSYVATLPGLDVDALPNPYRGLDYYKIGDAEQFAGRDDEAKRIHALLSAQADAGTGMLVGITGPSGCGKSSFLRAKVAAEAQQSLEMHPLQFRPTHFRQQDHAEVRCLPHLCSEICENLGLTPPPELVGPDALFHEIHLKRFQTWIDGVLGPGGAACGADAKPPRVLVCLDQFEEILDDLSEDVHAGEWRSLAAMLTHLSSHHGWVIVFTLEDSRRDRFDRLKADLGFKGSVLFELVDSDEAFYRAIITEPFDEAGIELADDIVDPLIAEVARQREAVGGASSPLPLLSLRLFNLFRELASRAPHRATGRQAETSSERAFAKGVARVRISLSDLETPSLELGDMVAELAETAWKEGDGGDKPDDIAMFLVPFVRLSYDPDHPDEAKLVLQSVRGRGFRTEIELESEFRRRRVLVPSGEGLRLVHESVVRRWPRAKKWFEGAQADLKAAAIFRSEALRWTDEGRPTHSESSDDLIKAAAQVLSVNLRDWAIGGVDHLTPDIQAIRAFALSVFAHAKDPLAPVLQTEPSGTVFHLAASYGLDDMLRRFLDDARDPKDLLELKSARNDRTAIANAGWGHLSTVKLLLEADADASAIDKDGYCALDSAVWAGREDIVEAMLPYVDPTHWDATRRNPIDGAAFLGRKDLAERLDRHGFTHMQPAPNGWTPLHRAATRDDLASFRYFLPRGDLTARLSEKTFDRTPLHLAAMTGRTANVALILTRAEGAMLLNDPGEVGETPLIVAAWSQQDKVVAQLLGAGADSNMRVKRKGHEGLTALHFALLPYASARQSATSHLKQATVRAVRALLACPHLDVAAETEAKPARTAWQMAEGLPDLQAAIAAHPNFPTDELVNLRAAQRDKALSAARTAITAAASEGDREAVEKAVKEIDGDAEIVAFAESKRDELEKNRQRRAAEAMQKPLLDAANAGDRSAFDAALAALSEGTSLTKITTEKTVHKSIEHILLEKGWPDAVMALLDRGLIDPWRTQLNYTGIYDKAIKAKATDLTRRLLDTMPERLPPNISSGLVSRLAPYFKDVKARGLVPVLDRLDAKALTASAYEMARLGEVAVFSDLVERGADTTAKDAWGRRPIDVGADKLRKALGQPPLGVDVGPLGRNFFHPSDGNWSPLEDTSLVSTIETGPENLAWDERVEWKEQRLPFYPGDDARLLMAKHPDWEPKNLFLYYLTGQGSLYRLKGQSPPIHEFNAKNPREIVGEHAVDYLRFFCFFVRGEEGPFYIVDGQEAAYLPTQFKADLENLPEDDEHKKWREQANVLTPAFGKLYRPPRDFGLNDEGHHRISSLVFYSNAIFAADFEVQPTGMIRMREDSPLLADLPVRIVAPLSG
ncbi:MAG: ankyrin repeat domain-containing protein [Pseudomonadota bacterium]